MQSSERLKYEQSCLECLAPHPIVEDHASGDLVCTGCGLVLESRGIDESSEWRTFGNGEKEGGADPSRVGGPVNALLSGGGLGTVIGRSDDGKSVGGSALARAAARVENPDKHLLVAFRGIGNITDNLGLNHVVKDRACELYKRIIESKSVKGRNPLAVQAATVYVACRQEQKVKTFKEVCGATPSTNKTEIGRAYKAIVKVFEREKLFKPQSQTIHADQYIPRFCHSLGLSHELQKVSRQVVETATDPLRSYSKSPWYGKSPISIAAAVIYMMSLLGAQKDRCTSEKISLITGVSEVTLMASFKDLCTAAEELIPASYASPEKVRRLLHSES